MQGKKQRLRRKKEPNEEIDYETDDEKKAEYIEYWGKFRELPPSSPNCLYPSLELMEKTIKTGVPIDLDDYMPDDKNVLL